MNYPDASSEGIIEGSDRFNVAGDGVLDPMLRNKLVTKINGRLHSGDIGYVDEDAFLYLVDRKKDMIISGGVIIFPRDIEELVVQHSAVQEASVFGIPHAKWGETPLGAVVLTHAKAATAVELKDWINQRVAHTFQRVYDGAIMDEFPRNVAGKILKREMRENFTHQL